MNGIQLTTGKASWIKINSAPHVGTEVTLVLPIDDKKCLFASKHEKTNINLKLFSFTPI